MAKMRKEKLKKENRKRLLGDIGEKIVALELMKWGFTVHKNLSDGYDILALRNGKILKIEVKMRYPWEYKNNVLVAKRRCNFKLTKNEMERCDFVIGLVYGNLNEFLIVNVKDINIINKKGGGVIPAMLNEDMSFSKNSKWTKSINDWSILNSEVIFEDEKVKPTISNKTGINIHNLSSNKKMDLIAFCNENNIEYPLNSLKYDLVDLIDGFLKTNS